jgi:hypothetical protein
MFHEWGRRGMHIGRPRCRWVYNIEMVLIEIWSGLIWLRIGTTGRLFSTLW